MTTRARQVALTVVAKTIEEALDAAKSAALGQAGTEILSSSLSKSPGRRLDRGAERARAGQGIRRGARRVPGPGPHGLAERPAQRQLRSPVRMATMSR